MGKEKLLPCPFCGETPTIEPWHGGAPTKRRVTCEGVECAINPGVCGETEAEAIARWNIRNEKRVSSTLAAEERGRQAGLEEAAKVADLNARSAAASGDDGDPLAVGYCEKIAREIRALSSGGKGGGG